MDTHRYIKKAMPQRLHSFSLTNLANYLELPIRKMKTRSLAFDLKWYMFSNTNDQNMVAYNILDCDVTLDLCCKLDLPNQMIAIYVKLLDHILEM